MIYLEMFYVFFLIGLFTIGGGYAMIPMLKEQIVSRGWLTMDELMNFFAIAESTPGPFALNTATLVGYQQGGILGSLVCTISITLPSFIIILIIARFAYNFLENKSIRSAFDSVKSIVVGLIFAVLVGLINANVFGGNWDLKSFDYLAAIIMVIVFLVNFVFKKLNPIFLILISGILGIILYGIFPL
jgi:chromate transporter